MTFQEAITKEALLHNIQLMLEQLAQPVTAEEAAHNWTDGIKKNYEVLFNEIQTCLVTGQEFPWPDYNMARGLDFNGVFSGDLLQLSAKISHQLREYRESTK